VKRWRERPQAAYTTEEELAHLRREVGALEVELVEREAELAEVRAGLHAFQLEYEAQVGHRMDVLAATEAQIARCREQIQRYRVRGAGRSPLARRDYIPVDEQYRQAWEEPQAPPPASPTSQVGPAARVQIKALYRQLCRRFHPDLTQDPAERAWRTEIMAAVNTAYEASSLAELEALAQKPDHKTAKGIVDEERRDALLEKRRQIQRRLQEVERELRDLMHGQMMDLSLEVKFARQRGRDLLGEMAAQVERDLERKRVELDLMVAQMRELGIIRE
jgi:chromosome segregation ATPase